MSVKGQIHEALVFASKNVGKREIGRNAGEFVAAVLKAVGLGTGYPWCAAFVRYCLDRSGCKGVGPRKGAAAVITWHRWALENGRQIPMMQAGRGDLFYWLNKDGTGHIGWVVECYKSAGGVGYAIDTIEGNTNASGSREGDGVYRKTRQVTDNIKFIRLY